jgi:cytochrome o ubiquinol oxidase operon protein cyoD
MKTLTPRLRTYISGYVLSIALTLAAYMLVVHPSFSTNIIVLSIMALAVIQFIVQAIFFLHLSLETKPRWRLFVFIFMISIVLIIVIGSIWIMNNLNYHMTPEQMHTYLNNQGGGF